MHVSGVKIVLFDQTNQSDQSEALTIWISEVTIIIIFELEQTLCYCHKLGVLMQKINETFTLFIAY